MKVGTNRTVEYPPDLVDVLLGCDTWGRSLPPVVEDSEWAMLEAFGLAYTMPNGEASLTDFGQLVCLEVHNIHNEDAVLRHRPIRLDLDVTGEWGDE